MLIIEWLRRLPDTHGIVIIKRTVTNCDSAVNIDAQALVLWATVVTNDHRHPDGFQVVDQDGRSVRPGPLLE